MAELLVEVGGTGIFGFGGELGLVDVGGVVVSVGGGGDGVGVLEEGGLVVLARIG